MRDIYYNGSDFELSASTGVRETQSVINSVLIGLFGGNWQQSEPQMRMPGEPVYSFWGNSHGVPENSETERLLRSMVLSTASPEIVRKSVLRDLDFMTDMFDIQCEVTIPFVNRLKIDIYLSDKKTGNNEEISYIWNAIEQEFEGGEPEPLPVSVGLDYEIEFGL